MAATNQSALQILVLEDNASDAELITRELRRAGFTFEWLRVEDEAGFRDALRSSPDLILADFHLPQYDGLRALQLLTDLKLDIPFILVSGAIGEETAVECMRQGADDYLLKDRLTRLGAAVERALERRELRRAREVSERQIHHLNDVLKAVLGVNQVIAKETVRERLLQSVCDILVQARGYHMIWIGRVEEGHYDVIPVASSGPGTAYLDKIKVTWDDSPTGRGTAGQALRSRRPVIVPDIRQASDFIYREAALAAGMASKITVPMFYGDRLYGVLNVYSNATEVFCEEEIKLLEQLSSDLSFALYSLEEQERRHQAEAKVLQLSQIVEQSPISIVLTDTKGTIEYVNAIFSRLTGYSAEEAIGQNPRILKSGLTPDKVYRELWQTIKSGKVWQGEMQNRKKNGELFWELSYIAPLTDQQNQITHFVALKEDITARKAIENELRQRDTQLTLAQHLARMGSWEVNLDTNEVSWSREMFRICGLDPDSPVPTLDEIFDIFHPADRQNVRAAYNHLVEQQSSFRLDARVIRADGQERIFHVRGDVPGAGQEGSGHPLKVLGTSQDVTEMRAAEQALRESEERHRTLFETMAQGVVYQNAQGEIISANPSAERILGLTLDQLQGRTSMDPRWKAIQEDGSDFPGETHPAVTALRTGKEVHDVVMGIFNPQDETIRWVKVHSIPQFRPGEQQPYQVYATFDDITERKNRERELETVVAVTTALRSAGTSSEMGPIIVEQVQELVNAGAVALALRDNLTGTIVLEHVAGTLKPAKGIRVPPNGGITNRVIASGETFVSNDINNEPDLQYRELFEPFVSAACIPLSTHNQTIGALWAASRHLLSEMDVRLLQLIAEISAAAIHRATLHEQMQNNLNRLESLREIDRAITGSVDLNLILGVVLDHVRSRLSVDAADILLFDPQTQWLEFARGHGFPNESRLRNFHLRIGEGLGGKVAVERRIIHEENLNGGNPNFVRQDLVETRFTSYIGVPLLAKGQVCGVLELFHRSSLPSRAEWMSFLETLAGQAAIAIDNVRLFNGLQRSNMDLTLAYDANIEAWSHALDLRDKETEGHSLRVTKATLLLARNMHMSSEELVHVRRGALLHDIGKMGVPDSILLKPGKLTDEEWEIMRMHPVFAYELLSPIVFLKEALDIPYCHHEKWDGSGYPRGLSGEQIPLAARIFAVIDVWDALRSDRPYRKAWPTEKVRAHIEESSGSHFDPRVVKAFLAMEAILEMEVREVKSLSLPASQPIP